MSKESLQKIVEKIKKLLALGESPNKEEAQTAIFRAQQLIEKYNIEEGLLEDEENKIIDVILFEEFTQTGRVSYDKLYLAHSVISLFNCYAITTGNKLYDTMFLQYYLIGPKLTVEIAMQSYTILQLAIESEVQHLKKTIHYAPKSTIQDFRNGIVNKISDRVREVVIERKKNRAEHYSGIKGEGLAVELQDKTKERIKKYIKDKWGPTEDDKTLLTNIKDSNIFQAGRVAGDKIALHNNKPVDKSRLLE